MSKKSSFLQRIIAGGRKCRIGVSKYDLRKKSKSYSVLDIIVSFIVNVNLLVSSPEVKEFKEPLMQRGACHTHSENIMPAMNPPRIWENAEDIIKKVR